MPFCCHRREYTFSSPSCEKKIHFLSQIKNRNLTKRSYITARHNSGSFEQSRYFQPTSGLLGNHPWWPIIFGGKKWFDRLETEQLFLQNFCFDKKALFLISVGIYKGTSWALFLVSRSVREYPKIVNRTRNKEIASKDSECFLLLVVKHKTRT